MDAEAPVIYREEVVGLLFAIADIAATVDKILRRLEDGEEEEEE